MYNNLNPLNSYPPTGGRNGTFYEANLFDLITGNAQYPHSPQQQASPAFNPNFIHHNPNLMSLANSAPPPNFDLNSLHLATPNLPALNQLGSYPEGLQIISQPKKYQVVNYNIFPAPEIEFAKPFVEPITIQAFLVCDNNVDIPEGFTNGDVQVLKVGYTRASFPALHLNRMTPIKNAAQQNGAPPNSSFSIKFKVGATFFFSTSFKLVSAVNQIPSEETSEPMRPRKSKEKSSPATSSAKSGYPTPQPTPLLTPQLNPVLTPQIQPQLTPQLNQHNNLDMDKINANMLWNASQATHNAIASKVGSSATNKRRAIEPAEEEVFLHVKVRGDETPRGFINLTKQASLKMARDEIAKSSHYPKNFRFWFEKMSVVVHPHQEDSIRALEAIDGTCLILELYDASIYSIDDGILSLWLSRKDKDPLVPIVDVIRSLFSVYSANTTDMNDLNIINGGISHFLANISKNRTSGKVALEDFKLFLKFYGPPKDCLNKVYNVYREPYFHGFARHSDAVDLLRGIPGAFLVRYSESQLKDGYFAFNVNKGNEFKDSIENYSMKYDGDVQCFIFRGKRYRTLQDFVVDPEYSKVLRRGIPKTTTETIKESKYEDENMFMRLAQTKLA